MELLSRRSSSNPISSLRRSRSVRASLKLVSKIRSHAMSVNPHPSSPPVSLDPEGTERRMERLRNLVDARIKDEEEKSRKGVDKTTGRQPLVEKQRTNLGGSNLESKTKEGKTYQRMMSADDTVNREPAESEGEDKGDKNSKAGNTKSEKPSLADRIRGRHKSKNLPPGLPPAGGKKPPKNEQVKSPKGVNFFRRDKQIVDKQDSENIEERSKTLKQILGEFNSYENPTFSLDSSTNSDNFNDRSMIRERHYSAGDADGRSPSRRFCLEDTSRDCEISDSKSDVSDAGSAKETQQGINELMPSIGISIHLLKQSKPKTMDNIANFLSNRRGTSVRPKKPKCKKDAKESMEVEIKPKSVQLLQTIDYRRRFNTSASSSSTLTIRQFPVDASTFLVIMSH